ncbi:hypothetical protein [Pseudonocardia parietis]|uniref:Uncharacterized protein n=1 Tax=Pseudonocardia parietis TaxID=570936 RepID=A0ABS4W3C7_9PSEU|nr:hypothetical protein [Pseudonocardia parietis]MBP2370684.1 hypothetical protein [Pseudonocardia parietis]
MSWSVDPESWQLVHSEGRTTFTAEEIEEIEEQVMPGCPRCRRPIVPEIYRYPGLSEPLYVPQWRSCPNGCTPR